MANSMGSDLTKFYKSEIRQFLAEYNKMEMDCEEVFKNECIIYYTFGFHDSEPPHSIIKRKLEEVERNKEKKIPSLWGICAKKNKISEIHDFLNYMKSKGHKDVYVVMKFTDCTDQLKKPQIDVRKLWTKKDLMKDRENLFQFCTADGEDMDLFAQEIYVKGNKEQNMAFVVEDYFLFDSKIAPQDFKTKYYRPYKVEVKKNDKGYSNQEINLLVKNSNEDFNKMDGKGWAIVLKLKAPYIVECY